MNINESVKQYAQVVDALKTLYDERDRLLHEIWTHMEANGQALLETPTHTVRIPSNRKYDPHKFQSVMGEVLSPDVFDQVFEPEHEVTKTVPAKVNGTKARRLWQMGNEVTTALEATLLPAKPEIKVESK